MLTSPTRIRASAPDGSMPQSQLHTEITDSLKRLTESLTTSNNDQSLGNLRQQGSDLRRIRQILIEDASLAQAKDDFRRHGGYIIVIDILKNLDGIYRVETLSRDGRIEFFEVVKGVLDVLSESLFNHTINRRHFANRFEKGGWIALETALVNTGLADEDFLDNSSVQDALELLFGLLLAFGVVEETVRNTLRGIQKATEGLDLFKDHEVGENAIRNHIKSKLSGTEILHHPEIVPIILRFWNIIHSKCKAENRPAALLWAIPITLQAIQKFSLRNEVAMHSSHALRPLLIMYFRDSPFPGVKNLLQTLIEVLLRFGVNTLDDAYQIIRNAPESEKASGMLLHGMVASRIPSFIQFDLSMHGYSSIELSTLGRSFPPTSSSSGYSIITWLKFDKFDKGCHTTIFGAYDKTETCFVALFVENDENQLVLQTSVRSVQKSSVQFRSFKFQEGVWYHIALIHKRPRTVSPSRAALFINGCLVEQVKCQYPSLPPVRNSSSESFASITSSFQQHAPVHTFLGTPKAIARREGRGMVNTRWSLVSFHLLQDVISDELIRVIHTLGTRYVGNLQDALGLFQTYRASAEIHIMNEKLNPEDPEKSDIMAAMTYPAGTMLPESKILISFSPKAVLDSEDRNHINETRLLKSLSRDAAGSLRQAIQQHGSSVIVNSAIPSYNEAMTSSCGIAILTGDPIVVVPNSLDDACWQIGGVAPVMLKLLDMSRTKDQVLRAVHILFQSLEGSWRNSEVVEREQAIAYGVLAGLLREKLGFGSIFATDSSVSTARSDLAVEPAEREELALELLRMILAFVGYSEIHPENALMINSLAYRYLLVDFDTWRKAPIATQKLYYGQFVHYTAKGQHYKYNMKRIVRMRKYQIECFQFQADYVKVS
jgi:beige protein homolog 1